MFGRRKSRAKKAAAEQTSAVSTPAEATEKEPAAPEAGESDFQFDPSDGPFDRSAVKDVEAFYKSLGFGYLDLSAVVLGIPPQAQLNAALAPDGSAEFHIVSNTVRVIPRAFAAPRTGGQWREWMGKIRAQLETQGAEIRHEDGPWGRELVATQNGAVFRLIGVEGPRWMLEARAISTVDNAEQACEEARDMVGRMIVNRGTEPMPAGEMLPLEIPAEITNSLNQARQQLAQQAQANARQQQAGAAAPAGTPAQQASAQAAAGPAAGSVATPQEQVPQPSGQQAAAPPAQQAPAARPAAAPAQQEAADKPAPTMRKRKRTAAIDRLREMEDDE